MAIRFDGHYKSPGILDKYDLKVHHHYLRFSAGNRVEIGIFDSENAYKVFGQGRFKTNGDRIEFTIRNHADGHKSHWRGTVYEKRIHFEISAPDFEDMPGDYDFVQSMDKA